MTKAVRAKHLREMPVDIDSTEDSDKFLLDRINLYLLNRARFELALAEADASRVPGKNESPAIEARRREAADSMVSHIELLESEVRHRPPCTGLGCAELLRVAELIMASQERGPGGPWSKGNPRLLIIAAMEGLVNQTSF